MKKKSLIGPILTAIAAAIPLLAHAAGSVPVSASETGNRWFVELTGAPTAEGNSLVSVLAEKAAFRRAAAAAGIRYTERRQFNTLFNGFSVEVAPADRARLANLPGVKALWPVHNVPIPTPEVSAATAPSLRAAIASTSVKAAQAQGLTGAGIKVGIIDTGLDIDHPAFGGTGVNGTTPFPNARVIAGYDLVGDDYNADGTGDQLVPHPDPIPDDCNGHGTHVGGIVGANGGGFTGVAPQALLGAYRVFGCTGSVGDDIIISALEMALADGMQVVNMSLGSPRAWPESPDAKASDNLVKSGVVVVASIGNSGPGGSPADALYAAGSPGVGDKVIGVASFDANQLSFTVGATPYGYNQAAGSPVAPTSGSLPMGKTGTPTVTDDGCNPLPAGSLAGQAALIRRGTCSFYIKATNAQAAGAAAVVLYNNAAGALNPTVAGTPPVTIPVVAITANQGAVLDAAIAAGPTTLTWTANSVAWPYGTGGLISSFSSFGLTPELGLKPNIGAPGGGIVSTYPLELGGSTTLSGTSMSSPYVAGTAALALQNDPSIKAADMLGLVQNTGDPRNWAGNPALGILDNSFRQGAGMVNIAGIVGAKAVAMPSQLSLGESSGGAVTKPIVLTSKSNTAVTYSVSHVPTLATGPNTMSGATYAVSGYYDAPATVTFSTSSVTVKPGRIGKFDATFKAPDSTLLPDRGLYGGYVVLTPDDGSPTLRIPYAGFEGDYQSTVVLTPTANGFPWLASLSGSTYTNQPQGATYTLADGDIPYFLMHLDHESRRVLLEAFDADTGKAWHRVSLDPYMTRNSTPGGFFSWAWDGNTFLGDGSSITWTVPNGRYVVKVSVLKALGDPKVPADTETWTSPVITIARP